MTGINSELKNIIEAALFVAGTPLGVRKLQSLFPKGSEPDADEIRAALAALEQDYANRPIELVQVGKGHRFQSRPRYAEWINRLSEERPVRYSRALLETLAIIAYRQPVTRGDIEDIRGVAVSSEIIRSLLERDWVREVGHRDVPGRPALFGTTPVFLEHFSLKGLADLPPLSELRDLEEISRELNLSLDFDETPRDESALSAAYNNGVADDDGETPGTPTDPDDGPARAVSGGGEA